MKYLLTTLVLHLLLLLTTTVTFSHVEATGGINIYVNPQSNNTNTTCGTDQDVINACADLQSAFGAYIAAAAANTTATNNNVVSFMLSNGTYSGPSNSNLQIYNLTVSFLGAGSGQTIIDLSGNNVQSFVNLVPNNATTNTTSYDQTSLYIKDLSFVNLNSQQVGATVIQSNYKSFQVVSVFVSRCVFANMTTLDTPVINFYSSLVTVGQIEFDNTLFTNIQSKQSIISITNNQLNIYQCNFTQNNAQYGIFNMYGSPVVAFTSFYNNKFTNTKVGGLIYVAYSMGGNSYISNSTFLNNQLYGSNILLLNSQISINWCSMQASQSNGIISALSVVQVSGCNFTNNTALSYGQIYLVAGSQLIITNSTFTNNTADSGAAIASIYSKNTPSTLTLVNNTFINNYATDGGAIYLEYTETTISNTLFIGNRANVYGGALYLSNASSLAIKDVEIISNEALSGGSIACEDSNIEVDEGVKVSSNVDLDNENTPSPIVTCFDKDNNCNVVGVQGICESSGGDSGKKGPNPGKIVGIVFGCLIGLAIIILVIYIFYKRHKNSMKYRSF